MSVTVEGKAQRAGDRHLELLGALPPVHALQHARVLVTHHRRDDVEGDARLHERAIEEQR